MFPTPPNTQFGIYLINGVALIGAIVGPFLTQSFKLSIKTIFVIGFALMSTALVLAVIFLLADVPVMTLISLSLLGFAWQISGGSY